MLITSGSYVKSYIKSKGMREKDLIDKVYAISGSNNYESVRSTMITYLNGNRDFVKLARLCEQALELPENSLVNMILMKKGKM